MESRKAAAITFLQLAASGHVRDAFEKHVGNVFRHHNPFFRGDAETLIDGDRILELWDIGQPVLADSVNANGMF